MFLNETDKVTKFFQNGDFFEISMDIVWTKNGKFQNYKGSLLDIQIHNFIQSSIHNQFLCGNNLTKYINVDVSTSYLNNR